MIKLENVSYRYCVDSEAQSIKHLNLHIKQGEFIVLCGKSGCGKTTVTRLMNGLIPHLYEGETIGNVTVAGKAVSDVELSDLASICGSVFQNPKSQFFNTDTTGELAFGCENLNFSKEKTKIRMTQTIQRFSLEDLMDRDIFKLSGGEKQQIACGSIYATNPDIYILDEPSSNMDAAAIMRFKHILKTLKEQGKTIVISEHRLYFLMDLADRFLYFADGELKNTYTPNQLAQFSQAELAAHGFRTTNLAMVSPRPYRYQAKQSIEMQNILCERGGKTVLNIPKLSLPSHAVVAIIGENGAGKSTFAEVFTGLLKSKGSLQLERQTTSPKARTEKSYMVMQDVNRQLFESSVQGEILLGAKLENISQIDTLMQQMKIEEFAARHPASLSGGQKQRVAICAAIAAQKEVMLYDEPTSGLDFNGMQRLCQLITARQEKHIITMIITHDLELILGCCTHVLHLHHGAVKDFYAMDSQGIAKLRTSFVDAPATTNMEKEF